MSWQVLPESADNNLVGGFDHVPSRPTARPACSCRCANYPQAYAGFSFFLYLLNGLGKGTDDRVRTRLPNFNLRE